MYQKIQQRRRRSTTTSTTFPGEVIFVHLFNCLQVRERERERERERVGGNELPTSTTDTNTYVSKDITKNEV